MPGAEKETRGKAYAGSIGEKVHSEATETTRPLKSMARSEGEGRG